jgi:hypothetical protein
MPFNASRRNPTPPKFTPTREAAGAPAGMEDAAVFRAITASKELRMAEDRMGDQNRTTPSDELDQDVEKDPLVIPPDQEDPEKIKNDEILEDRFQGFDN